MSSKPDAIEAFARRCFVKKLFLKISQNWKENTCARDSFLILIKLQAEAWNFIKKESLAQVFPANFVKFLRTAFFYGTPPVATSDARSFRKLLPKLILLYHGVNIKTWQQMQ